MATASLTGYDVVRRVLAVGTALTGVGIAVVGVLMFWGPMRQVLAAPVFVVLGAAAYIGARTMWWLVAQDLRARS
jgi:hypothetical protein